MPTLHQSPGRVTAGRFAVGRVGRELTREELELSRLREALRMATKTFAAHPCHGCEIKKAQAEQAVEDFLRAHPGVAA